MLEKNGEYLARLAQVLYGANQPADADRVLRGALDRAAQSDSGEALDARLELASFLISQGRDPSAVSLYAQAVSAHPDNTAAWEGLIGAYAHMRDFPRAMTALRSIPPSSFRAAKTRSGFLSAAARRLLEIVRREYSKEANGE
jgi:thioredoxin-like negative regulator of GroEL